MRREVDGERAGELGDRALRGVVDRLQLLTGDRCRRSRTHDRTPAVGGHVPGRGGRHEVHPADVHPHRLVEVLERRLEHALEVGDAGVRGEPVEAPEPLEGQLDCSVGRFGVADVRSERDGVELLRHLAELLPVLRSGDEAEAHPVRCEGAGDGEPDPLARTGDDRGVLRHSPARFARLRFGAPRSRSRAWFHAAARPRTRAAGRIRPRGRRSCLPDRLRERLEIGEIRRSDHSGLLGRQWTTVSWHDPAGRGARARRAAFAPSRWSRGEAAADEGIRHVREVVARDQDSLIDEDESQSVRRVPRCLDCLHPEGAALQEARLRHRSTLSSIGHSNPTRHPRPRARRRPSARDPLRRRPARDDDCLRDVADSTRDRSRRE